MLDQRHWKVLHISGSRASRLQPGPTANPCEERKPQKLHEMDGARHGRKYDWATQLAIEPTRHSVGLMWKGGGAALPHGASKPLRIRYSRRLAPGRLESAVRLCPLEKPQQMTGNQ